MPVTITALPSSGAALISCSWWQRISGTACFMNQSRVTSCVKHALLESQQYTGNWCSTPLRTQGCLICTQNSWDHFLGKFSARGTCVVPQYLCFLEKGSVEKVSLAPCCESDTAAAPRRQSVDRASSQVPPTPLVRTYGFPTELLIA